MLTREASCFCGQLHLTCSGEPARVSICYCLLCQRRSGSAFGIQARFPRDQVSSIEGRSLDYVRGGDDGDSATFHFCPECGSTVYYEGSWMPGFIAVPVGAFGDPGFPAPTIAVFEERRHPWAAMPGLKAASGD